MITYKTGDLFLHLKAPYVLVHGANAQGVMGSGFAKQFKLNFPEAYYDYLNVKSYNLGDVITTYYPNGSMVCSAITQRYYGRDGQIYVDYEAVETSLTKVAELAKSTRIYLPFIGGGLGGGDRDRLKAIFEKVFSGSTACIFTQ